MRHKVKHIHFVGIGGSGMSGIAEVLFNLDFKVTGSDLNQNAATHRLNQLGITVHQGHSAAYVQGADVLVVSTAIKNTNNPEVEMARQNGIPVIPRAMMLAELMRFRQGIAVAGTHGKTTTTSLVASILAEAGLDPTFVIGGRLNSAGTHARLGTGDFLVAEADESDASFLYLSPILAIVTNIDADHMETYQHDFQKLKQAFIDFLQHLPFYGTAVLCVDNEAVQEIIPALTKPIVTYGFSEQAQIRAVNVRHVNTQMHFDILCSHRATQCSPLSICLNLPGLHNVQNALAAIAIAYELGISNEAICKALQEFKGVGRRFQRYGDFETLDQQGLFTLIDDYGHHPAEMAATVAAVRGAYPERRLVLVFQPHRYTRTRDLFEDFIQILSSADSVILTEVYAAGETPIVAADGRSLTRAVRVLGKVEPLFVESIQQLPQTILEHIRPNDVVLTMGAGSINQIPSKIEQLCQKKS